MTAEFPIFCDRCGTDLKPGSGNFFQINIEAVADPTGPDVSTLPPAGEIRKRIEDTIKQINDVSEQEALDQVYRRLTLFLCCGCFAGWIENPAG